jgi:hypothetical protein
MMAHSGSPGRAILPPWVLEPSRLRSLLDLMKIYRPDDILRSLGTIHILSSCPLESLAEYLSYPEHRKTLQLSLYLSKIHCEEIDLKASSTTIHRLEQALQKAPLNIVYLHDLLIDLIGRIQDELAGIFFFSLNLKEANYYQNPIEGWEIIVGRFPGALADIEETHKCFAVARYAASVFHSLHVVEICLIDLGTYLGVQDPLSGWTAVSNRLTAILKTKYGDLTPFERENRPFLEQLQGTVDGLKNAWRNKISHAQGKLFLLSVDFTPEIAEEIFFATRAFARRVCEGLPSRQAE